MSGTPSSPLAVIEHALTSLAGKSILDVGCGTGGLVRALVDRGARVAGIDPTPQAVAEAKRLAPEADLKVASAELLPFDNATFDAITIVNTLHHVPVEAMDRAMREAARTIQPKGCVVVIEPLPEGSFFDALKIVEDETVVRIAAQEALERAIKRREFDRAETISYVRTEMYSDVDDFLARIIAVDPARETVIHSKRAAIAEAVHNAAGRSVDGKLILDQPIKADILRRAAN